MRVLLTHRPKRTASVPHRLLLEQHNRFWEIAVPAHGEQDIPFRKACSQHILFGQLTDNGNRLHLHEG